MNAGDGARAKATLSKMLQQIVSPSQIDLDCLTNTEKIANEARLLATFLCTSASAFAFNGSGPSPVTKMGEMIWRFSGSCREPYSVSSDHEDCLVSHWAAAQKAMQACAPTTSGAACGDGVLFSCPIVLRYRGKNYPKACITVALGDPFATEAIDQFAVASGRDDESARKRDVGLVSQAVGTGTGDVVRRALETLASSLSEEISASYSSYRDAIERQLAEAHLREERDRLGIVLQSIDVGLCLIDAHSRVTWTNRVMERWFGPARQLHGKRCCELYGIDGDERAACPVHAALRFQQTQTCLRKALELRDGPRDFRLTANPVFDGDGQVSQVLLVIQDVTDRLGMERELRKRSEQLEKQNRRVLAATRQKNRFFVSMSHELRTPLTSIIGFTELLLEDTDEPLTAQQRAQLQKVASSAHRLLEMINDLLDLSKIEAGRMSVNLSKVDVRQLVDQIVTSIAPLVRDKDIELATAVERDLPPLCTDEQKLEQILVNLLSNATKFTAKGQVKVQASSVRGKLHISVSDTGIGIRRSDLKRIFEEFQQIEQPVSQNTAGTGLGLAIAKRLAYLLGGDISVRSRLGEGSTFTLVLPFTLSRSFLNRRSETADFL